MLTNQSNKGYLDSPQKYTLFIELASITIIFKKWFITVRYWL